MHKTDNQGSMYSIIVDTISIHANSKSKHAEEMMKVQNIYYLVFLFINKAEEIIVVVVVYQRTCRNGHGL